MPKNISAPVPPIERLAARMIKLANAQGTRDIGRAVALLKRRAGIVAIDAAVNLAIEKGWLRRDGGSHTVTRIGVELGASRSGKRTPRVIPF